MRETLVKDRQEKYSYFYTKNLMGEYDKIIKENIEAIFLPLAEKLLGIKINNPVDLPEKLQSTIEREPDFLKKVAADDGQEFILHLEFQTTDEPKMVYRMAEYKALLQRKFEIPVRQYVVYLGTDTPKMRSELSDEEKITGFEIQNIHDLPVNQALESDVPEEIILSILTDYPEVDAEKVVNNIIRKLLKVSGDEATLNRYIQQLLVLSRLRKLDKEIEKQVSTMPITYDIEQDYLYNKAYNKAYSEAKEETLKETINEMLKDPSLTLEKIASFTKTSIEFVKQVKDELNQQ